jgi:hypothetical protein
VGWVQIDLEVDDHDHLISPEERLRIAMTNRRSSEPALRAPWTVRSCLVNSA